MSKLLIPNTCQVPNVIFDEVMPGISNVALRVLMVIVRQTYGFNVESKQIGLDRLMKLSGLSRQGVVNGVKDLGGLIAIKRGPANSRVPNEYALNIDISTGELVNKLDQSTKLTSQKSALRPVNKVDSLKPSLKPNTTTAGIPEFETAWNLYPKRAGGNTKENARKAWSARIREGAKPAEMIAGVERYAEFIRATGKEHTQYVKQAATFFGPAKHYLEEFELPRTGADAKRSAGGFVG